MPTHVHTYPENLVNVGPVHFEIIGLQYSFYFTNESVKKYNIGRTGHTRGRPGGLNK